MEYLDTSLVTSSQPDLVLAKIKDWIQSGWPKETPEDDALRPFFHWRCELSVESVVEESCSSA